jgi:hypothetical protein
MRNALGWLLIIAGVLLLCVALWSRHRKGQIAWSQVLGVITHSEVRFTGELYHCSVSYDYSVNLKKYTGNTIRFGSVDYNWSGPAERVCQRYSPGAQIPVYFDMNRPETSVLELGMHPGFMMLIFCISTLLVVVGFFVLVSTRSDTPL